MPEYLTHDGEDGDPEAIALRGAPVEPEFDPYESYTTPEMYGNPKCPVCHGRGRLNLPNPPGYKGPPSLGLCRCVLVKEVLLNLERGRTGLSKARRVPRSPLLTRVSENIRIVADEAWFDAHLRHVVLRQPPRWDFRVVSDADIVQAWLATAAAKGMEIFDANVRAAQETHSLTYMTLSDLAKSSALLIVRLGVKTAPNKEAPNVLLELIYTRKNEGLPTWIWEGPRNRLEVGHICWSEFVEAEVGHWERVAGTEADLEREIAVKPVVHRKLERVQSAPPPPPVSAPSEEEEEESSEYDPSAALGRIGESPGNKRKQTGFKNKGSGRR